MEQEAVAKEGEMCVKVMTEEQIEVLRRQISDYASICEQLVEMHRATTCQQDSLPGMRMTGLYSDPFAASGGAKMSARQRWTPTPVQLQILESIFYQGNGTPTKQRIKEITSELSQHGQISETNVYNWFQNRRARSKRKQSISAAPNNTESEAEADSLSEKRAKTDKLAPRGGQLLSPSLDDHPFQDVSSELRFVDPDPIGSHGVYLLHGSSMFPGGGSGQVSAYGNSLPNSTEVLTGLIGKMEAKRGFSSFQSAHQDHAGNRRVY